LEKVGYWRTTPASIEPTNTATMNAAVTGTGAAVTIRASLPSGLSPSVKCSQNAQSVAMPKSAKNIRLIVTPPMAGWALLNGTP
jgi:hypothetical protein